MDWVNLQQQLVKLPHLSPIQREWFSRVCFQLSFNQIDTIQTLGSASTGKSTLALALAELLSEQANVALLNATAEQQVVSSIEQQWFGRQTANVDLQQQVNLYAGHEKLCLIIDDAQSYSLELIAELTALNVLCFIFTTQSLISSALTLTLKDAETADAAQLSEKYNITAEQLESRFKQANIGLDGSLNRAVKPLSPQSEKPVIATKKLTRSVFIILSVVAILILAVVFNYNYSASKPREKVAQQSEPAKPLFALPKKAASSDTTLATIGSVDPETNSAEAATEQDKLIVPGTDLNTQSETKVINPETAELTKTNTGTAKTHSSSDITPELPVTPVSTKASAASQSTSTSLSDGKVASSAICDSEQLQQALDGDIAIQLAVLSNVAAFEAFQSQYPSVAMQCYQRSWQGNLQIVVLLGPYAEKSEALMAKKALPAKLTKSGSFFKSLKAIKAEIDAFTVSQQLSTVD
ncbi:SPOR domain-containing protein [Rheinheimera sp. WS51]|uniref:SPOR domain-containing protein n=1 Tax=Rheinheimera sp. WS51 TaxID=3425886 RepID=UPI003D8F62D5